MATEIDDWFFLKQKYRKKDDPMMINFYKRMQKNLVINDNNFENQFKNTAKSKSEMITDPFELNLGLLNTIVYNKFNKPISEDAGKKFFL